MLSGMLEGERHHTFTESYFCAIDLFIRPITSELDCEIATNEIVNDNIAKINRFICKYILQKSVEKINFIRAWATKFQQWPFHYSYEKMYITDKGRFVVLANFVLDLENVVNQCVI